MIRLMELFAGIGAQATALGQLGVPYTSTVSEIDKRAYQGYEAIHGPTVNLGDVRQIETLPDYDILTYSFPCQDLSIAGKEEGIAPGTGTRSSLLWEVGRILEATREREGKQHLPKVLIMENVDAILNKNHIRNFKKWIDTLSRLGYMSSYEVLNAYDYGIPQYRARCFMVSSLDKGFFKFPEPQPLKLCLGDLLETCPDERYYLSKKRIDSLNKHAERHKNHGFGWEIRPTDTYAKCLTCMADRSTGNFIKDSRGIRKLTPLEYWRLQGQPDENFKKVARFTSDSQLYKMAGNSIAIPCMREIFRGILGGSWTPQRNLSTWGAGA